MAGEQRICDYGDSSYRQDFWEGQGREYEDVVERQVLKRILPKEGNRLLEIGAGFGRLSREYHMYKQVVLLDYSLEQLQYARQQLGDEGYLYVAANAYKMPFKAGIFDGATMIRVIHHMENVPAVMEQIQQIMSNGATFILEFANKRNLKAMIRHSIGRNVWNPFTLEPVEFVELNFNFHPSYMRQEVQAQGFTIQEIVPVSFLRLGLLKRTLPTNVLAGLDSILQVSKLEISPSIFFKLHLQSETANPILAISDDPLALLKCPESSTKLQRQGDILISQKGVKWAISDGVYDFRNPLAST